LPRTHGGSSQNLTGQVLKERFIGFFRRRSGPSEDSRRINTAEGCANMAYEPEEKVLKWITYSDLSNILAEFE